MLDSALLGRGQQQDQDQEARPPSRARSWAWWCCALFLLVVIFATCVALGARRHAVPSSEPELVLRTPIPCPAQGWLHSRCTVRIFVKDFMCRDVREEVERRIRGKNGWTDPRGGTYLLLDDPPSEHDTLGSHTSANGLFADRFLFTYHDVQAKGCDVTACSESRLASWPFHGGSSNFCNVFNLVCGKYDDCSVARHNIVSPTYAFESCPFHAVEQCSL